MRDEPLFVFARFHAHAGCEDALAAVLREVVVPTREETGNLAVNIYRSVRDPRLFYIHSRWASEAAFDRHGELPHTLRFVAAVEPLIDHPLDVARTLPLASE
jgi:quinol monooxygenase YgiN